jgi:hypothetical protein
VSTHDPIRAALIEEIGSTGDELMGLYVPTPSIWMDLSYDPTHDDLVPVERLVFTLRQCGGEYRDQAADRIEALEKALLQIDHRLEFFNDRAWTTRPRLILERVVEVSLIAREALDGES